MKGRPHKYQHQRIILKAQETFWKRGYNATSLSDLSHATGAGAGSLYNIFKGGKKELFREALQQRREDFNCFKDLLQNSDNPIHEIKQFFLNIAESDSIAHQKGCIVANTIVEMTFVDPELEEEAAKIMKETEALYKNVILQGQIEGTLQTKICADVLAKYLITFWLGINSLRRIYQDHETLKSQIILQLEILN